MSYIFESHRKSHPFKAIFGEEEKIMNHNLHAESAEEIEKYASLHLPFGKKVVILQENVINEYPFECDGETIVKEFVIGDAG